MIAQAAPDASKHFFAIYHVSTEDDSKAPRQVWTPTTKHEGVTRIPVKFTRNDGAPWTVGEKVATSPVTTPSKAEGEKAAPAALAAPTAPAAVAAPVAPAAVKTEDEKPTPAPAA